MLGKEIGLIVAQPDWTLRTMDLEDFADDAVFARARDLDQRIQACIQEGADMILFMTCAPGDMVSSTRIGAAHHIDSTGPIGVVFYSVTLDEDTASLVRTLCGRIGAVAKEYMLALTREDDIREDMLPLTMDDDIINPYLMRGEAMFNQFKSACIIVRQPDASADVPFFALLKKDRPKWQSSYGPARGKRRA